MRGTGRVVVGLVVASAVLVGCGTKRIDLSDPLLDNVVAMDADGNPLDPTKGLERFESDDEFHRRHLQPMVDAIRRDAEKRPGGVPSVMLYVHGALNTKAGALENARRLHDAQNVDPDLPYPVFVNWDASVFTSYWSHLALVRQGRRNLMLGAVSVPIVLGVDLVSVAARAPITWTYQLTNRATAEYPNLSPFNRHTAVTHQQVYDQFVDRLAGAGDGTCTVRISKPEETQPLVSWASPVRFVKGLLQAPFQIALSPIVAVGGRAAWTSYRRSTRATMRRPDEYDNAFGEGPDPDGTRTGSLALLMSAIQNEFGSGRVRFTLVGHSTGAIILNRLIENFPDERYERIVYLASAATIDDFESSVLAYMSREDGPGAVSRFYNITLDTYADAREVSPDFLPIAPSGSLLEWLDVYFTSPPAHTGRVIGKWDNAMAAVHIVPDAIRDRVTFKKFPYGDDRYPQKHGELNDVDLAGFRFLDFETLEVEGAMLPCP